MSANRPEALRVFRQRCAMEEPGPFLLGRNCKAAAHGSASDLKAAASSPAIPRSVGDVVSSASVSEAKSTPRCTSSSTPATKTCRWGPRLHVEPLLTLSRDASIEAGANRFDGLWSLAELVILGMYQARAGNHGSNRTPQTLVGMEKLTDKQLNPNDGIGAGLRGCATEDSVTSADGLCGSTNGIACSALRPVSSRRSYANPSRPARYASDTHERSRYQYSR